MWGGVGRGEEKAALPLACFVALLRSRSVVGAPLARTEEVGEQKSFLFRGPHPLHFSPLSPNRPRSGLHDIRPFALGHPDLHPRRGQVGHFVCFLVRSFFSPSSPSVHALVLSLSLFALLSDKNPMADRHRRYLDLPCLVPPSSTPERRYLDVPYATRRRRGREGGFEATKCGAIGRVDFLSLFLSLSLALALSLALENTSETWACVIVCACVISGRIGLCGTVLSRLRRPSP